MVLTPDLIIYLLNQSDYWRDEPFYTGMPEL